MIGVLLKTGRILRALRVEGRSMPLSQIAKAADLSKSVARRILLTLIEIGLVTQDPSSRMYSVGSFAFEFGVVYLKQNPLYDHVQGALERLTVETGHTSYYGVADGSEVLVLKRSPGSVPIRAESATIGDRRPLHASALGKALLAYLPEQERERLVLSLNLRRFTAATITDPVHLTEELARTRERGYSVSMSEAIVGLISMGAPVLDLTGAPIAAISVSAPIAYLEEGEAERIAQAVVNCATRLSTVIRDSRGHNVKLE